MSIYQVRRDVLIAYLKMKADQEDWHGVADAANDLRELDAEERGKNRLASVSDER